MPVPEVYRFGEDIKVQFEAGAAFAGGSLLIEIASGIALRSSRHTRT
jgi:hypothetical protein